VGRRGRQDHEAVHIFLCGKIETADWGKGILMGLGYLVLGRKAEASAEFRKALRLDPNHQGLIMHQKLTGGSGIG